MFDSSAKDTLEKMFDDSLMGREDIELKGSFTAIISGQDDIEVPDQLIDEDGEAVDETNLFKLINSLGIPAKIKLALFGNKNARSLLIREPNRQVALFVLQNNRLRENEVVDFAKNTNLDEQIHRAIARNPSWTKNYEIKLALVSNPKAPQDVAMKQIKFLRLADLKKLAKSKNIPSSIATLCKKMVEKRSKK